VADVIASSCTGHCLLVYIVSHPGKVTVYFNFSIE
jgi:hypothetical protein